MGWAGMVVLIVLISGIVKIVQARYGVHTGRDGATFAAPRDDAERARMAGELSRLRDRVAVLERIVTDGDRDRAARLEREIEELRERRELRRQDMEERR